MENETLGIIVRGVCVFLFFTRRVDFFFNLSMLRYTRGISCQFTVQAYGTIARKQVLGRMGGGELMVLTNGFAFFSCFDTIEYFSSYGPIREGRVEPEIVAPGDAVSRTRDETTPLGIIVGVGMCVCFFFVPIFLLIHPYYGISGVFFASLWYRGKVQ